MAFKATLIFGIGSGCLSSVGADGASVRSCIYYELLYPNHRTRLQKPYFPAVLRLPGVARNDLVVRLHHALGLDEACCMVTFRNVHRKEINDRERQGQ